MRKLLADSVLRSVKQNFNTVDRPRILDGVEKEGYYREIGTDEECRASFVNLQGAVESALLDVITTGEVEPGAVKHVTHTPTVPTPFIDPAEADISASVLGNPDRRRTVDDRKAIMRELVTKGAWVAAVFAKGGVEAREKAGATYIGNKPTYSAMKNFVSFESPSFTVETYPSEKTGATAWVNNSDGAVVWLFYIMSTQANNIAAGKKTWEIGFGNPQQHSYLAQTGKERAALFKEAGFEHEVITESLASLRR